MIPVRRIQTLMRSKYLGIDFSGDCILIGTCKNIGVALGHGVHIFCSEVHPELAAEMGGFVLEKGTCDWRRAD